MEEYTISPERIVIAGKTITNSSKYTILDANVKDVVETLKKILKVLQVPGVTIGWQIPNRTAVCYIKGTVNLRFTGLAMGSKTLLNNRLVSKQPAYVL